MSEIDWSSFDDDDVNLISDMAITYANSLRQDYERVASFDAPELLKAAAADIYNKAVAPVSQLHVKIQQERLSRGIVKAEEHPGVSG